MFSTTNILQDKKLFSLLFFIYKLSTFRITKQLYYQATLYLNTSKTVYFVWIVTFMSVFKNITNSQLAKENINWVNLNISKKQN